jgi:hypothetical protein
LYPQGAYFFVLFLWKTIGIKSPNNPVIFPIPYCSYSPGMGPLPSGEVRGQLQDLALRLRILGAHHLPPGLEAVRALLLAEGES